MQVYKDHVAGEGGKDIGGSILSVLALLLFATELDHCGDVAIDHVEHLGIFGGSLRNRPVTMWMVQSHWLVSLEMSSWDAGPGAASGTALLTPTRSYKGDSFFRAAMAAA